jgi:hypothetical protein
MAVDDDAVVRYDESERCDAERERVVDRRTDVDALEHAADEAGTDQRRKVRRQQAYATRGGRRERLARR